VDLSAWIAGDLAAVRQRFLGAIREHVPRERWRERADGGGSSIAALLLHVTVHQDLATQTALGDRPPLFSDRSRGLGLAAGASPLASLQEAEDPDTTGVLDLGALEAYAAEVHEVATRLVTDLRPDDLDRVPPAGERLAAMGGIPSEQAPWLYAMWEGKPAAWFVRWEIVGHTQGHVGEMVSVRDRLGYRPF
jgi:hypothetical protein